MAVKWTWKHKVGEIHYKDLENNTSWKLEMFGGNMMCAFIYRFKKYNEETGKSEEYYNFFTFLIDVKHAKRILKDDPNTLNNLALGKHKVMKIKLCVTSNKYKYSNEEMLRFAKLLTKYKYKVELY